MVFTMHQKGHLELVYIYIQAMQMVNYVHNSYALKQVSVPRPELCGAQLLAKLIKSVLHILCIPIDSVHLWTDSRLVLTWLQDIPTRWNIYVANSVFEIQDLHKISSGII
jgi:hypothetical protein